MQGINRLFDNTIKKTKPSGGVQKLCDGDKLYLFILPTGKKIWRVLWREKGKDKQFTIGEYPAISLKMAREERTRVKGLLAQGLDPNGEKKRAIGEILRKLCEWKGVKLLEAECRPDHIHMLVEMSPKMSVSSFIGHLKGKSSLMIYDQFGDLKFKYRNRMFWGRGIMSIQLAGIRLR